VEAAFWAAFAFWLPLWRKVFNMMVQNSVEKQPSTQVTRSPRKHFNALHRAEGWHFRGKTCGIT
jgi:hypothetical protein